MALSILQFPASCSLAQSPIIFSVSESSAANTSSSFQYNADLYYWTGTPSQSGSVKYTLVKYPNTANCGIFDFSRIVNSTLVDLREQNSSNVVYFKGEFYYSYRSGSGYAYGPGVSSGVYAALDGYGIFQEPIGQPIESKSIYWPIATDGPSTQSIFDENTGTFGAWTLDGSDNNVNYLFYSSSLTSSYLPLSSSLNSSQLVQQVPTFPSEVGFPITHDGWYNICTVSASVSSSIAELITNVSASFFSEAMGEAEVDFTIDTESQILNNANSICWYTSSLDTLYVVTSNNEDIFSFSGGAAQDCARVKSVDCVTGVIELGTNYAIAAEGEGFTGSLVFALSCDNQDNIFTSASLYTVNTLVSGTPLSCIRFEETCKQKYPNVRIKWKNRYGQYDYHNFYMVSRTAFNTTSRTYAPQIGTWEGSTLSYPNYASSKLNYINDSSQTLSVNTNWLSEEYNELFKQLLVSEEIYWMPGEDESGIRPITISTSNLVFKTGAVDKLIQYQFDFDFGQGFKLLL
jgi:hypothetical protein